MPDYQNHYSYVFYSLTVGFHVGDFLVTGNLDEQETAFWELSKFFTLRDEGEVTSYLGISYEQRGSDMFIQMSSYVDELLNDFEMTECKPVKRLPYDPDASATSTQQFDDRSRSASLVGSLSVSHTWLR